MLEYNYIVSDNYNIIPFPAVGGRCDPTRVILDAITILEILCTVSTLWITHQIA